MIDSIGNNSVSINTASANTPAVKPSSQSVETFKTAMNEGGVDADKSQQSISETIRDLNQKFLHRMIVNNPIKIETDDIR